MASQNHQRNSTFPHEQVATLDLPHIGSSFPNRLAYRMILIKRTWEAQFASIGVDRERVYSRDHDFV